MQQVPHDIRSFRRSLRALERQVELSLASQTECCGVTPAQCHVLLEVSEAGSPSVSELALALELDAYTLSRAVDGLVKAGFVLREEDPLNRRRYLVSLSPAGRKKVSEIDRVCDRYYEGMLASLPADDRGLVVEVLPRFTEALKSWRSSCCGSGCRAPRKEAKA